MDQSAVLTSQTKNNNSGMKRTHSENGVSGQHPHAHLRNRSYGSSCHKEVSELPSYQNSRSNSVMKHQMRTALKQEHSNFVTGVLIEEGCETP